MNEIEKIKELETELIKLRLKTRHIDFTEDYNRSTYLSKTYKTQKEIQLYILEFLDKHGVIISNATLIKTLVKNIPDLTEKDFEKTNSGSIRIYSTIRSAVVNLTKKGEIVLVSRGQILLKKYVK